MILLEVRVLRSDRWLRKQSWSTTRHRQKAYTHDNVALLNYIKTHFLIFGEKNEKEKL